MRIGAIVLLIPVLSGCASSLQTYDGAKVASKGIPIRAPALVEIERVTTFELVSGPAEMVKYCTPETMVSVEFLPIGDLYFVKVDPAAFGKSDFSLELTDAGALKKVTLGSDPGTSAAVEAATGLVSTVLPFVAAPKEAPDAVGIANTDPTAKQLKDKHCAKTKTAVLSVKRLVVGQAAPN